MSDEHTGDSCAFDLRPILIALGIAAATWFAFEHLAARHPSGKSDFERSWIEGLRDPQDSTRMIGPPLLEESVRDFSALGGYAVVSSLIMAFSIFIGLTHGRPFVRFFLITVLGGYGCSMLLKLAFGRERPSVVPHLSHVATTSFPSSHAMVSSIVYLSMGLLLAQRIRDGRIRRLLILLPMCLTVLVGFSRIAMGVHYPTDVLAGWTAGLVWSLIAFRLQPVITGCRRLTEESPKRQ